MTLVQSLEIKKNIISELSNIKTKISQLYHKNKEFNPCSMANVKYGPLTSEDVEGLFVFYKHIQSDRRTNMTPERLEKYIIVNTFYKK